MATLEATRMRVDAPRSIEISDVARAFDLINNREWDELLSLLKNDPGIAQVGVCGKRSTDSQLALHETCKQQPPVEVIEALICANPSALKVKGQFGCTPLHWAVSYGASAGVVAKLIQNYPPGTRVRDAIHQLLPIHLAAKYGVPDDVVLEILVAHPEGYFIRDSDGLTPLDYANQLRLSSDRERLKSVLNHAPLLCKVSKAAQVRVAHEHEAKLRSIQEAHAEQVSNWEQKYVQEKLKAKSRSQALKIERDTLTNLADTALRQLEEKVCELTALTVKFSELETKLDKERKLYSNSLDVQKAEMQTLIHEEKGKVNELLQRVEKNEACIGELHQKIEGLEMLKTNLEAELNSEREVTEMMVEEVEKLQGIEALLNEKVALVEELEGKLDMGNIEKDNLSKKLEDMENSRVETEENWNRTKAELESMRQSNAELQSELAKSTCLSELYKARNQKILGWFKQAKEDFDSWESEEAPCLPETHAEESNDPDDATVTSAEDMHDLAIPTIEDTVETPYYGVELSLERITDETSKEDKPRISPTALYRTRISPAKDDADRVVPESAVEDSLPENLTSSMSISENECEEGTDQYNDEADLVPYLSTKGAVPEAMPTSSYTVITVVDDNSSC